jgi:uncharacterized protein (TIGR02246 family)
MTILSNLNIFGDSKNFAPSLGRTIEMNADERQIRELVETWMTASKAGDLAAVLDLMTDDVIFMTPGRAPFGKGEFAANGERMKDFTMEGRHDLQEIEILGKHAYIRNYLEITLTKAGDAPKRMSGHTMGILRKESDGRWRLARDANLVMPANCSP